MKNSLKIFLIVTIAIMLIGCWDMQEIDRRIFVGIIGIDKSPEKAYDVHFSCPVVREIAGGEGGGGGGKTKPVMLVSSIAKTVNDAARNVALRLSRNLFFEHTRAVVIGEEVARDDLKPILNTFIRQPEFNRRSRIAIAKGTSKKVLEVEPWVEKLKAFYIETIFRNSSLSGKFIEMDLGEFMHNLHASNGDALVSKIVPNKEQVSIGGAAIIKDYRLIGWLTEDETQGANFFRGKIRGGDLVLYSKAQKCNITFSILKANRSLRLLSTGDIPEFLIRIHVEGNVASTSEGSFISEENISTIEKLAEQKIASQVNKALDKIQKQYEVDVINLGDYLYKFHPGVWDEYKQDWNEIFPDVDIQVEVDAKVKNIGVSQ